MKHWLEEVKMKRWLTLTLTIGIGLLLVTLTLGALRWESPPALAANAPAAPPQTDLAPLGMAAYEGINAERTSSTCYFPLAHHNPSGRSTKLFFQNTGISMANVTISLYSPGSEGTPTAVADVVLPPMARGSYPVSELVTGVFTGAAIVEADQPLACSADILDEQDPTSDETLSTPPP
jgi:hypothetical protein